MSTGTELLAPAYRPDQLAIGAGHAGRDAPDVARPEHGVDPDPDERRVGRRVVVTMLAAMPEDGEAAQIHVDALRCVEIGVAEQKQRGDRHGLSADLRTAQVDVGIAEEDRQAGEPWHSPPSPALHASEGDAREALRPTSRSRRGALRVGGKVVRERLELRPRPRRVDSVETLREFLEREAALDHVSAEDPDRLLAFRIGGPEGWSPIGHE